jgi:hypothetical protein
VKPYSRAIVNCASASLNVPDESRLCARTRASASGSPFFSFARSCFACLCSNSRFGRGGSGRTAPGDPAHPHAGRSWTYGLLSYGPCPQGGPEKRLDFAGLPNYCIGRDDPCPRTGGAPTAPWSTLQDFPFRSSRFRKSLNHEAHEDHEEWFSSLPS